MRSTCWLKASSFCSCLTPWLPTNGRRKSRAKVRWWWTLRRERSLNLRLFLLYLRRQRKMIQLSSSKGERREIIVPTTDDWLKRHETQSHVNSGSVFKSDAVIMCCNYKYKIESVRQVFFFCLTDYCNCNSRTKTQFWAHHKSKLGHAALTVKGAFVVAWRLGTLGGCGVGQYFTVTGIKLGRAGEALPRRLIGQATVVVKSRPSTFKKGKEQTNCVMT